MLQAATDCLVKIVDRATNKLEALIWMKAGTTFRHDSVPESIYSIVYAEGLHKRSDSSIWGEWFGEAKQQLELGYGSRAKVHLSINSTTHTFAPTTASEFNRFPPPKR